MTTPPAELGLPDTPTAEVALRQPVTLSQKLEYARFLATSGMLPAIYRERPGNVLFAVEYGEMLGLPAMAAILNVHVIEGRPSAAASLVSALVRRAGHRIRTWGNDESATTEIVRSDDPEFTYRSEWTIDRARKAELTSKAIWKKYTAAMLKARSITECARDACQEALLGMGYTPEELGAEVDAHGRPLAPAHDLATFRPVSADDLTGATDPDGAVDAELVDVPVAPDAPVAITKTRLNELFALMTAAGLAGKSAAVRADRLRLCQLLVGRDDITTSNDLTEDEGVSVCQTLRGWGDDSATAVRELLAEDQAAAERESEKKTDGDA